MSFEHRIASALEQRKRQGLWRSENICQRLFTQQIQINHHEKLTNFSSNDYLGLSSDIELKKAWQHGVSVYGCGSASSPAITGRSTAHSDLQAKLCEWLGYSKAILFNSGFSANQALIFTLLQKDDLLIQDKLNHASLMEAGMLCAATMYRYRHNDMDDLKQKLSKAHSPQSILTVSEGVFSMDGDMSPLPQMAQQVKHHQAWLAIDDAHGLGVLGETGGGISEATQTKPDILIVTFGKALGVAGAAILCSQSLGDYLTQFARHYVNSTAMPPAQAYAVSYAIDMVQQQSWRREKLSELNALFTEQLSSYQAYRDTATAIKPWLCGTSQQALDLSQYLKQQGLWVSAIRPPTVAANGARLRITLTANHSTDEVTHLAQAMQRFYQSHSQEQTNNQQVSAEV